YEKTIEIYSKIPFIIKNKLKLSIPDDYYLELSNRYTGIYYWLFYWDKKYATNELKKNGFKTWEKAAMSALRRYQLVYEMYNLDVFKTHTKNHPSVPLKEYNFIWFYWELSILYDNVKRSNNQKHGLTKDNHYKQMKKCIDDYENFENIEYIGIKENELFDKFDIFLEGLAKETAIKYPDFDAQFFTPYNKAQRSENSYGKKHQVLKSTKPTQDKRGRKPGWEK
ncbi:MAG: hypothetical protein AAFR37_08005, partial [Cyanobacteria bacterium J06628_3]